MKEVKSYVAAVGCTACSQFLYDVVEVTSKMSVTPKNAVTTDSVIVEQEPTLETRRRLRERKTYPDGLDARTQKAGSHWATPNPCAPDYRAST